MNIINGYKYKGLKRYKDRHGKPRCYYRPTGQELPDPASVSFRVFDKAYWDAVGIAKAGKRLPNGRALESPDSTIEKIVRQYEASPGFAKLAPFTQANRKQLLGKWSKDNGHKQLSTLRKEDIEQGLQNRKATPPAANNWMAAVRSLFAFCIEEKLHGIKDDPTQGVKRLAVEKTGGWQTWTEANVEQFIRKHPKGTREYLALMVLLWSGQRRSDVLTFGWHKFGGNMILFKQSKTGKNMKLPIAPSLLEILPARDNVVDLKPRPFLLNASGDPFTPHWFTEWFGNACSDAGLDEGLSAHGTRKLAAQRMYRTLLRAGRTDALAMTMAFTGHKTEKQLRVYLGEDFEQEEYAEELLTYMN